MKLQKILLFLILLISFSLRVYGLNWDQGFHLHPDERAIELFTQPIHLPTHFSDIFSPQSPLNPHFFAYGSLPLYLLHLASILVGFFSPFLASYNGLNLVGRVISACFDTATIFVIYTIGKRIFNSYVGLLSGLFYGISTLAIQTAHFYVVDPQLTFFITLCLYELLIFYEKPRLKHAIGIGILFGLSLATKNSALALIVSIGFSLFADIFLLLYFSRKSIRLTLPTIIENTQTGLFYLGCILLLSAIAYILIEPYALIDFSSFLSQTLQQYQMTRDAFTFPYTLQYVGKIPYVYEIKNIFLWGQGPILATLSILGTFFTTFMIFKKPKAKKWPEEIILFVFFGIYFMLVGKFAVGFMRYMLPIYPLLSLFAGYVVFSLFLLIKKEFGKNVAFFLLTLVIANCLIWPASFLHIYSEPNTRIQATDWINQNIPPGKTLAIEHWDDSLPLNGQEKYHMVTLPLYDPDTSAKWQMIDGQLAQADYIIIASNRLYVPLQKLADCSKFPPPHCYPQTANYYHNLFSGKLGFQEVAEFSVNPTIPFLQRQINDQSADESFTVYDHPKIMIFEKEP